MLEISQVDNIKTVTLSRPPVNALSPEWIRQFSQLLEDLRSDSTVSVVHLRSSQRVFSAGFDLTTFHGNFRNPNGREAAMDVVQSLQDVCRRLENLEKVTVAEVSGAAMGGGLELALSCDMRVAANDARLALPETQLGLLPGAGGTQRLTRAIGKAKAMDLCLTGRMMDVQEAERAGLVARIVPLAELQAEALKAADAIASKSLPSVMMAKESVDRAFEVTLREGIRFERRVFASLFATQDQKEGMAAFSEKRKPDFKNL